RMDRILRHAARSELHGDNLCHRAVHILIFNETGELYLQRRSRSKDRHPLLWDSSAAGHVMAGESYDETAKRELQEELGINVRLKKVLSFLPRHRPDRNLSGFIEDSCAAISGRIGVKLR